MQIEHLIDGAAVASQEYFETVNPATQEVLAQVARGGQKEIDAAVAAAKAAFPQMGGQARGGEGEIASQAWRSDRGARPRSREEPKPRTPAR